MSCQLPSVVALLTHNCDAWIVGSAANPSESLYDVRDWDLLIPFHKWHNACLVVPDDAKKNSLGGWKFRTSDDIEIDIWPGELSFIMKNPKAKYAWHPLTNTRLQKI